MPDDPVRLGLIGDNIARSQAPRLHELAGRLAGIPVTYDRSRGVRQRPRARLARGAARDGTMLHLAAEDVLL